MLSYHDGDGAGADVCPAAGCAWCPATPRPSKFDLTLSLTHLGRGSVGPAGVQHRPVHRRPPPRRSATSSPPCSPRWWPNPAPSIGRLARAVPGREGPGPGRRGTRPTAPVRDALVHELIAEQAGADPDAPALRRRRPVQRPRALTYGELDRRAEALAARLRAHGVRAGRRRRRVPRPLAQTGRHPAGDPQGGRRVPAARPGLPVGAARLHGRGLGARPVDRHPRAAWRAGLAGAAGDRSSCSTPRPWPSPPAAPGATRAVGPDNLAYVIFTSGSTGRPQGRDDLAPQRARTSSPAWTRARGDDARARWLAVTSISFDISVLELLWTLARGFQVVAARRRADGGRRRRRRARCRRAGRPGRWTSACSTSRRPRAEVPATVYRLLLEGASSPTARLRRGLDARAALPRVRRPLPEPVGDGGRDRGDHEHVEVRAGSVVLPLHNPLRVAEEWSVVDNLSGGRVGLSFASGWQPTTSRSCPTTTPTARSIMMHGLESCGELWRGAGVRGATGQAREAEVRIFPPPVPRRAAGLGHERAQPGDLPARRGGRRRPAHPPARPERRAARRQDRALPGGVAGSRPRRRSGHVTLMLHTFVGTDVDEVREIVREPLSRVPEVLLRPALGPRPGARPRERPARRCPSSELDELVAQAFDRFFDTSGLIGTPERCADLVDQLKASASTRSRA